MKRLVVGIVAGVSLALVGVVGLFVLSVTIFADECDPSENGDLAEMTSEELDELCGVDRSFRFTTE